MQKIWIIGFFFKNSLHYEFEMAKEYLQIGVLGYIFI